MNKDTMTSTERVAAVLDGREPDRVPFFLLLTMHGAKELGLSIRQYFSKPENIIKGQLQMRARYKHDCLYPFFYGAAEVEAWGGEVVFYENGPPNAGRPVIGCPQAILNLKPPEIADSPVLARTLEATSGLAAKAGNEVPIIGVVISPFSLPIMQMGFEAYLVLMHEQPDLFKVLMALNEEFCINWAKAQIDAGATAICYFDPMSSPAMVPRQLYLETGYKSAVRFISTIDVPVAAHTASGPISPIIDDLHAAGAAAVCPSTREDLADIKAACSGRMAVIGNLNGVDMRRWNDQKASAMVRDAISRGGQGGGFILADNHGEIPFQVPETILDAISGSVYGYGWYPLK